MKKGFFLIFISMIGLNAWSQEITNVSFVQEGEVSKLVIETDKPIFAERFHVSEDKQIILDLKDVKSSPKLLRGIDTSEFPGSSVFISGYKKPGSSKDIRFAIQLRDNVRSILEATEKRIVLNIENRFGVFSKNKIRASETTSNVKVTEEVSDSIGLNVPKSNSIEDILENLTLSGPKKYIGKRISINVKSIPVPDLLNMIADTSGFNIILDEEVRNSSPLNLTLTNVPWDQALDTVMNLSKLVAEKNSNILVVKTLSKATREKEDQIKAAALKEGLEPLVTRVFLINYAALADISRIIKDYLTPQRSSMQTDERTNSLIVKDTVESIERIKKIVETLDTQTPQILIEAKVVEANESSVKNLGLANGLSFGYDPVKLSGATPVGPGFSFSTVGAPAIGAEIQVFKRLTGLDFRLQLLESEAKGRVISTPRVVTQNKKPATLTSTEQTSYQVQQQNQGQTGPTITWETISANLNLTVTPQVTNDGAISMQISLNKDSFGTRPSNDAPPNKNTRNVNTNVLVENGSTVVIGGLYQTDTLESRSGIPFLKDLPLVGWIFRSADVNTTNKNELIIFITPRILNQEEAGFTERAAGGTKSDSTTL